MCRVYYGLSLPLFVVCVCIKLRRNALELQAKLRHSAQLAMFNIKNAIVNFLSDSNIWCAAFPSVTVFGEIEDFKFKKYFLFYKKDYSSFYKSVVQICHTIATNSVQKQQKTFSNILVERVNQQYHCNLYYYENQPRISLTHEYMSEIVYKIVFSTEEFNDFLFIASNLILPSLCLSVNITNSLLAASTSSSEELLQLSSYKGCESFVQKHKLDDNSSIYLLYYRELLIIIQKLSSLYNPCIKEQYLNSFLQLNDVLTNRSFDEPPPPSNLV